MRIALKCLSVSFQHAALMRYPPDFGANVYQDEWKIEFEMDFGRKFSSVDTAPRFVWTTTDRCEAAMFVPSRRYYADTSDAPDFEPQADGGDKTIVNCKAKFDEGARFGADPLLGPKA